MLIWTVPARCLCLPVASKEELETANVVKALKHEGKINTYDLVTRISQIHNIQSYVTERLPDAQHVFEPLQVLLQQRFAEHDRRLVAHC